MSETQEMTFSDVAEHNSKKDLFIVVHDKVYDATAFVDEHPGGEEVLLDVGGQDATEAFEDVGHSDEARQILEGMEKAKLKRVPGDPEPHADPSSASKADSPATSPSGGSGADSSMGLAFYALVLLGGGLAFGAYKYLQAKSASETK
ncbi:MAG: hypothetical protein LQ339_001553 [Xanthoria mediterranea]|nr:MAG: hypothetical protein LQ339_001553 [Xanthoria mediterranea]